MKEPVLRCFPFELVLMPPTSQDVFLVIDSWRVRRLILWKANMRRKRRPYIYMYSLQTIVVACASLAVTYIYIYIHTHVPSESVLSIVILSYIVL